MRYISRDEVPADGGQGLEGEAMKTSPCRGCGKPILWVETEKGARMPLDPEPIESGKLIVRMGPALGQAIAHTETAEETTARLKATEPAARVAFMPHHATCPKAGDFSANKKKAAGPRPTASPKEERNER
jgi:hypothetical protein